MKENNDCHTKLSIRKNDNIQVDVLNFLCTFYVIKLITVH